ncbi:preprotein translocase subunit YajC [Flavobacteriaceae bacterium]|nr:preprotein translocase subunit YajC [Flavobacteriaceae bacterium]MDC0955521.1 preprotein translocase subunit YajC [bacterium]
MDYLFPLALLVVFVFFIILPPINRSKNEKKFASSLKRGTRVITKSGMYGKVFEINDKDDSCIIETQAGKIKFDRQAISMDLTQKLNKPKA